MIEIIQEYWKSLLWTDGYRFTGVAITLWLLISSVVMGGILAVFLAIGRVSNNKFIQFPIWLFTYRFSQEYTAVCAAAGVLFGDVYAGDRKRHGNAECVLPQRPELYGAGVDAQYLRLYHKIFAGAFVLYLTRVIEAARAYGFSSVKLYRCIILPSALRIALPAYSNEVILMLHSTALAFTATVPDLLKIARDIDSATYQPFTAFGVAAVLYLIISYVLISLFRKAEKRWLQHIKPSSTH